MAQFDYFRYGEPDVGKIFLLDIQNALLSELETRVVVPMRRLEAGQKTIRILQPTVSLSGVAWYLSTSELAAISVSELGERQGNLGHLRQDILAAIDLILTGV